MNRRKWTISRPLKNAGEGPRAFTLVELMVAVFIMATLMAVAAPLYSVMIADVKETRAKNLYRGLITSARTYAQANRIHAGIRFQRSFKDHRTYGVLVYHDAQLQELSNSSSFPGPHSPDSTAGPNMATAAYLACYAVPGVAPTGFPFGMNFIELDFGRIAIPRDEPKNDDLDDVGSPEYDRKLQHAMTFTIMFAPDGTPVQREVVVRRKSTTLYDEYITNTSVTVPFDQVFNDHDDGGANMQVFLPDDPSPDRFKKALLMQDDPDAMFFSEISQMGAIPVNRNELLRVKENERYTKYVKDQPRWILTPYTGNVIEVRPQP
jgi:prepilin-type N-terminal cleavage/methylation domain-containing protein